MQLSTIEIGHLILNGVCALFGIGLSIYWLIKIIPLKEHQKRLKIGLLSGLLVGSIALLVFLIISLTILKTSWGVVVLTPAILLGVNLLFCIGYFVVGWWTKSKK
ncbi:hypothetical protein [Mesoplasma seiffertii]|uniref:hypothetical protein n=1 Tax=Mesoplasma seiffertii TaxID=28224 RepID=UPI00047D241B|nr:hypothetical protein [Mesoplasma seiffertii]